MNRTLFTGLILGAFAGFLIGYFVGVNHFGEPSAEVVTKAPAAAPAAPIPGAASQLEAQQRIAGAEAAVAADPKNVQAWIALGNDYFDLHQPQKSVDAYAKALALEPNSPIAPDLLTDQGVMLRELKQFDKAIANFKQASKLNPKHVQSLFNLGIVYSQDKHDHAAATATWKKIVEVAPTSTQAEQARAFLAGDPHAH